MLRHILLGVELVLCYQSIAASSVPPQSAGVCRKFNTTGMTEVCGYNETALYFPEMDELNIYETVFKYPTALFTQPTCTRSFNLLHCAHLFPRCARNIRGPFLPCRRVCTDIFSRCDKQFLNISAQAYWPTKWSCHLLPEKDEPNTMDYRKRCFEPQGFKPCDSNCHDVEPPKCFPLVIPECQNLGYKFTIYPERVQQERHYFSFRQKHANSSCGDIETELVCTMVAPPCFVNDMSVGATCREVCHSFFQANCTSDFHFSLQKSCLHFPTGKPVAGASRLCKRTQWYGISGSHNNSGQSKQKGNLATVLIVLLSSTTHVAWLFR